jgi:hypothetical protein
MTIEKRTPDEKRYLFENISLPQGFSLPKSYLELTANKEDKDMPDLEPWFWLTFWKELANFWYETLKEQFPSWKLVPFCKDGSTDDIACFDGDDTSGDPAVVIIHSFCSPGYEYRGRYKNFDGWFEDFKNRALRFKADLDPEEYRYDRP